MYKSVLYRGVDKYIQIKRTKYNSCSTCIYHEKGICKYLEKHHDVNTMIANKDLCGPYHKFYKNK